MRQTIWNDQNFNIGTANKTTVKSIEGFKTIQQDMVKQAESIKLNLADNYGSIVANANGRNMLKTAMGKRLRGDQASTISQRKLSVNAESAMMLDARSEKLGQDIKYMEDRMGLFFDKQAESAMFGGIKGFQQAVLPLLYLESIKLNAREVMPFKVVDSVEIPRTKVNNFIKLPDGTEYNTLDAFKDPAIMAKILGSSNIKKEVKIAFNKENDIATIAGVEQTSLMPVAYLTKITYNDGTVDKVALTGAAGIDSTGLASVFSRGKFAVKTEVKDAVGTVLTVLTVQGEINFEKSTVVITGFSSNAGYTLVDASIVVTFDGGDFANVIEPFLKTEDKITSVSKRLNMSVSFDKPALAANLRLDNIDRSIEFTAAMYEISNNTKDYHAYNTIEETWLGLTNSTIAKTLESEAFTEEFKVTPGANFRPVHSREWAEAELPNAMEKLMVKLEKKLPSEAGLSFTFYGDAEATTQIPSLQVMVGGDESTYGGVKVQSDIMFARIGKFNAKVVTTRRATETNYLQCVPYSNAENNEIFAFNQFYTLFDQNNEYRNPLNPLLPGLHLIDIFDTDVIFPVLGRVNFTN